MNKLIAIFLLTIYTSSAVGVAVNYHYCHGSLAKISFLNFDKLKKGCGCNPLSTPKQCCKDKLQYQKSDNHQPGHTAFVYNLVIYSTEANFPNSYDLFFRTCLGSAIFIYCAPRSTSLPIFLLNRTFRI